MRFGIITLVMLFSLQSFAHEYYFAFAEVKYNESSQKMEATLTVSTHDLEMAIEKKGLVIGDLATIKVGSQEFTNVSNYLLQYFSLKTTKKCHLKLIGIEVSLNGTTNFYFDSGPLDITDQVTISFDLLMNQNQKQQNKVTFYYKTKNYTRPFLYSQRVHTIKLNKD